MMNPPATGERNAMGRKTLTLLNGLIIAAFAATLVAVAVYGPAQRHYLHGQRVTRVDLPQQALDVWRENGVKGRILFHFARRNNARDDVAGITAENYIYHAMRENRIRRLYHIIPDGSWPEVAAALNSRPQVSRIGNGFRLVIEGMPVHVLRLRDVTPPGENVLVNIEGEWWGARDFAAIDDLLRRGVLASDLVTVSGRAPAMTGEKR